MRACGGVCVCVVCVSCVRSCRSLDAVKRKLGDMEGSSVVDDDAQKRPKVESAAADEPASEAATGEEREGDEGGHDDAPNEEQLQQIEQFKVRRHTHAHTHTQRHDTRASHIVFSPVTGHVEGKEADALLQVGQGAAQAVRRSPLQGYVLPAPGALTRCPAPPNVSRVSCVWQCCRDTETDARCSRPMSRTSSTRSELPSAHAHRFALSSFFARPLTVSLTRTIAHAHDRTRTHKAAKEGFERLLAEVRATLTADTKWSDFERTVEADPRFKAMGETSADRKERRALFDAAVAPLRQAKEKGTRPHLQSVRRARPGLTTTHTTTRTRHRRAGGAQSLQGAAGGDPRDRPRLPLVQGLPSSPRSPCSRPTARVCGACGRVRYR
jgi:hypothetical protein